jgi:hypothetical protein
MTDFIRNQRTYDVVLAEYENHGKSLLGSGTMKSPLMAVPSKGRIHDESECDLTLFEQLMYYVSRNLI